MKLYAIVPGLLQILAWPFTHAILRFNGTFTVHGGEHLKNIKGSAVIVSNHVNDLDPVFQRAVQPFLSKPLFWVARHRKVYDEHGMEQFTGWRGLLYNDWFFRSWGAYPAYKGTGNYQQALRHHINLLKDGFRVGIFPQGGKAKFLGEGAPAHGGAVFLAQYMKVPLIPIAIKGTHRVGPKKLFLEHTDFEVFILPPLIVGPEVTEYKQVAQEVMRTVWEAVYQQSSTSPLA
ncbi:MAG: lysophospholipid acyltransferase family protein [Patescibacteria group bacterium]